MKKDMGCMKGEADQILKTVTTMERGERLQQGVSVRNDIHIFPSNAQPALINPLYGVPPRFYPQVVLLRTPNQRSVPTPQPKSRDQAHN